MSTSDPIQTFLAEASDLLGQVEEIVLELEQRPDNRESIDRLFRAFHTLKGSGAMFGFENVAAFTHHVETALDRVRAGEFSIDRSFLNQLLIARDQIELLLKEPPNAALSEECDRLVFEFAQFGGCNKPPATSSSAKPCPTTGERGAWRIFFQPPRAIGSRGLDPLALLGELRGMGRCTIEAITDDIPALAELAPEQCHLSWRIHLSTDRDLRAIRDVFIFVEDDSNIRVDPCDKDTASTANEISQNQARSAATLKLKNAATAATPTANGRRSGAKEAIVRVSSVKLDRLVTLVGELVMNQSRLAQVSSRIDNSDLAVPVEAIERLVAELRDSVLGIRMMPIGSTFNRFKRLVHDLSHELGKEIEFVTEGAETELDKTVLDHLGDPLVHLIRNCIDHGIGPPDERVRNGKTRHGTIRLNAAHAGSHVVISIQDDGRGLDTAAIRTKAVACGLIAADATVSEKELHNLIFLPGFSTARNITNVSGRGVGMDVVKKQIDALRGSISLVSQPGVGTTINLTLPLTLAIIDGLLVGLGGDHFIVPMSAVLENVELHRAERARQNGRNAVVVRGELIPYIRLRDVFGIPGEEPMIEKVVIARHESQRVGLVVDRVFGSHQTVIQPLGRFYRQIEVCSGATIMGDGRVALILDPAGVVNYAERSEHATRDAALSSRRLQQTPYVS